MEQYNVRDFTVEGLLGFIKSGQIAIPELQRPFVWKSNQIRDLIDSLYNGYPIGYLIVWHNPNIVDKNGEKAIGKKIMIDGQQRITALMTALLGMPVLDKDFKEKVHKIAFNPFKALEGEPCFEVQSTAIKKDKRWVPDISEFFDIDFAPFTFIPNYCEANHDMDKMAFNKLVKKVCDIMKAKVGAIELNPDLDIAKVTDIFTRINSTGVKLTEADFVMSTLAADEQYGGNALRKTIDYFSHTYTTPAFLNIVDKDITFATSPYYPMVKWVAHVDTSLFSFSYDDVLRIAFTSQYHRGKMANLTELLHGRNFQLRTYEQDIKEDTYSRLGQGIKEVLNRFNYEQFTECLKSAGFIDSTLIRGQMALDFAYTLFLRLRESDSGVDKGKVSHYVRQWYVMSVLTGRYSTSPETAMERDLRSLRDKGFLTLYDEVMSNLSDTFWDVTLVQDLESTATITPSFNVFLAAQCRSVDPVFLSNDSKVRDLLHTADRHHIFPQQYLRDNHIDSYNQVANYVYLTKLANIRIGKQAPYVYLAEVADSIRQGRESDYTSLKTEEELRENLRANCIPEEITSMDHTDYPGFLVKRRKLMAAKIRDYFRSL